MAKIDLTPFAPTLDDLLGPDLKYLTNKVLRELSSYMRMQETVLDWIDAVQQELVELAYYELTDVPTDHGYFVDLVYGDEFGKFLRDVWFEFND